jgi:hypothetical protein
MKLSDLKRVAVKAQQELQLAEQKSAELLRSFKLAKAKTDQARVDYKRLRKLGKQAKKLAGTAEEQLCKQRRTCKKAQQRLAKAEKKLAKASKRKGKPAVRAATRRQMLAPVVTDPSHSVMGANLPSHVPPSQTPVPEIIVVPASPG